MLSLGIKLRICFRKEKASDHYFGPKLLAAHAGWGGASAGRPKHSPTRDEAARPQAGPNTAQRGTRVRAVGWPNRQPTAETRARYYCKRTPALIGNQVTQWITVSTDSRFATKPSRDFIFATQRSKAPPRSPTRSWPAQHGHSGHPGAETAHSAADGDQQANTQRRGAKRSPTVHYRKPPATTMKLRDDATAPAS
jgi:hypothetical protein